LNHSSFVIDSVCLFVTLLQIASSFLFLDGIEPFLAIGSQCGTLRNVCPKFTSKKLHKIAYKLACMTDRPDMSAYHGVFGDGRFNGTMQNVVGPTLVAMAMKFALGAKIKSPTGLYFLFFAA